MYGASELADPGGLMADDPANALAERGPRDRVIMSEAPTHAAMRMGHYRVAAGLVATLLLLDTAGGLAGEKTQVKWNGNYPHNNERTFSESYQLGWSKNFMNGFPRRMGSSSAMGSYRPSCSSRKDPAHFHSWS